MKTRTLVIEASSDLIEKLERENLRTRVSVMALWVDNGGEVRKANLYI